LLAQVIFSVQYKNIFGDNFQWNQVPCQHLFRPGGGDASPPCVRAWQQRLCLFVQPTETFNRWPSDFAAV